MHGIFMTGGRKIKYSMRWSQSTSKFVRNGDDMDLPTNFMDENHEEQRKDALPVFFVPVLFSLLASSD